MAKAIREIPKFLHRAPSVHRWFLQGIGFFSNHFNLLIQSLNEFSQMPETKKLRKTSMTKKYQMQKGLGMVL